MEKSKELKNSFTTSRKNNNKPTAEDIERITTVVEKKISNTIEEELVKTSIDFPAKMFKDMKIRLLDSRKSMREYVLSLVEKDLYK